MKKAVFAFVTVLAAVFSTNYAVAINFKNVDVAPGHSIQGKSETYISEKFNNDGEVNYTESLSVTSNRFTGNGVVSSPEITIKTKKFDFKGTIVCSDTCTISSMNTVNEDSFKREGNGRFVINGVDFSKDGRKGKGKAAAEKKRVYPPAK